MLNTPTDYAVTMCSHFDIGDQGEDIAVAYLLAHGYRIMERNVRFGKDELDIIAYDQTHAMVVFVEVKSRAKTESRAYPVLGAVDKAKRRCLRRAVAKWTVKHQYHGPGRTDVICVAAGRVVRHLMNLGSDFF